MIQALPDSPLGVVGERCSHRIKPSRIGEITAVVGEPPAWCSMKWEGGRGPRIVHRRDLVLLPVDGSDISG
jgi:hypothetical protein